MGLASRGLPLGHISGIDCTKSEHFYPMPTSLQDPQRAKRQRGSVPPTEWDKEREWVPLWLAGPIVALASIGGLITIIWACMVLVERIAK